MPPFMDDELERRRAAQARPGRRPHPEQSQAPDDLPREEPLPPFTWKDILAMTIAAYQIIFPILFLFIGVVVLAYLLFRFAFS